MLEVLSKYGWLAAIGLSGALAWIGWSARNAFVPAKEFRKELEDRDAARNDLEKRLIRAEAEIEDKPTANALHELAVCMTKFGGDIRTVGARLDGLQAIVARLEKVADRQEDFLLNKGGGK